MDLKTYIDNLDISPHQFAAQAKVSAVTLYRVLKGKSPRREIAKRISEFTNGLVSVKELRKNRKKILEKETE